MFEDRSLALSTAIESRFGLSRREFMTFCTGLAATLGLSSGAEAQIAEALVKKDRPSVIWLHHQECTGCSESLLRTEHPTLEKLIFDIISLDYHETLFAAAGHQAEAARHAAMEKNKGNYLLVVEGSIPTKDGGIYCKVGGQTALDLTRECAAHAKAVVAMGSCASWGGMPATPPNPTGAAGVGEALGRNDVVCIPGCPPNPYNLLATLVRFLTFGTLPELDAENRPLFAYGRLIHDNCERRSHFDAGRFALEFGDDGHRKGYCLYKLGCKGPETHASCPSLLFNDGGSGTWPVGTGHPCIGCTEKGIGFHKPIHALAALKTNPPTTYPPIQTERGEGASIGATALVAGAAGLAIGAGVTLAAKLGPEKHKDEKSEDNGAEKE